MFNQYSGQLRPSQQSQNNHTIKFLRTRAMCNSPPTTSNDHYISTGKTSSVGHDVEYVNNELSAVRIQYKQTLETLFSRAAISIHDINCIGLQVTNGTNLIDHWEIKGVPTADVASAEKLLSTMQGVVNIKIGGADALHCNINFDIHVHTDSINIAEVLWKVFLLSQCFSFLYWLIAIIYLIWHPSFLDPMSTTFSNPCRCFIFQAPCVAVTNQLPEILATWLLKICNFINL